MLSRGRTRSPSDLVDNHHDLLEVAQHAVGDDIVHSLRTDAVPVDKPSAGLQDAARKPDYSGASREGSMSSSRSRFLRIAHSTSRLRSVGFGALTTDSDRYQHRRANVRSEPTTDRPARRCARLIHPRSAAFSTWHPRWEPRSLPAESCNHHIRSLTTSSKMVGSEPL